MRRSWVVAVLVVLQLACVQARAQAARSPGGAIAEASRTSITLTGSGTGGASSASGCRKVTLRNRTSTLLGLTAYRFNTWTRWCWERAKHQVYDVSTGWFITDADTQEYWRGIVNDELGYYDFGANDGHPHSAYKHYRQGRFENCVLKYGCIATTYPTNTIRSYDNGTYAWKTG
jgi:hypothetical protein